MRQLGSTALKRLNRTWRRRLSHRLCLVLQGVQSPYNVGAIVRTAAALGVTELYLSGPTAAPRHANAQRVAMGTDRYLSVETFDDATAAIGRAHSSGYRVVALELADEATPIQDCVLGADVCIVVGNEDHGLSVAHLAACDAAVYIPQFGKVGSLNVSAAVAIACYEVRRQQIGSTIQIAPPQAVPEL